MLSNNGDYSLLYMEIIQTYTLYRVIMEGLKVIMEVQNKGKIVMGKNGGVQSMENIEYKYFRNGKAPSLPLSSTMPRPELQYVNNGKNAFKQCNYFLQNFECNFPVPRRVLD